MREVYLLLKTESRFDVVILSLQHLGTTTDAMLALQAISRYLDDKLSLEKVAVKTVDDFYRRFKKGVLIKPLILILDEFDALPENAISELVGVFRNIYISRQYQSDKPSADKDYLLHGVALIGVRAVLGVENVTGSPFNVQRSLHVPNLSFVEVDNLFKWYERESGQPINPEVVTRIWYELNVASSVTSFQGQSGLTCWFGELLTETYNQATDQPITISDFEDVYADMSSIYKPIDIGC